MDTTGVQHASAFDCEHGKRQLSDRREWAFSCTIALALGLAAGLTGFFILGPLVAQSGMGGSEVASHSHSHSLGKFMMPGRPVVVRHRSPWSKRAAPAVRVPPLQLPRIAMQATATAEKEAVVVDVPMFEDTWQARLDKALLDVDLKPRERADLLSQALRDSALPKDVREAVTTIREKGFGPGHPEFIEKLWPTGTIARGDIEGLNALRQQVPEALKELQKTLRENRPSPQELQKTLRENRPEDISKVLGDLAKLASDTEKQEELREEAKDAFRRTPKNLETPKYDVVRNIEGPMVLGKPETIEVRSYAPFTIVRTPMKSKSTESSSAALGSESSGTGFNTLASYLFGKNEAKEGMKMTMPVEITTSSEAGVDGSMSFVLPKKNSDEPPAPLDGTDVTIEKRDARLVAVKAFAGIVTNEEIDRQKAILLEAIAKDGELTPVDKNQVTVLQYNSPFTIPWRRRNEVAVVVNPDWRQWAEAQAKKPEGKAEEKVGKEAKEDPTETVLAAKETAESSAVDTLYT